MAIKVNAGEVAEAVKFAAGKINKKRKTPVPILIDRESKGKLLVTDANYHAKGKVIAYTGRFSKGIEVDGRQLLKVTQTYPAHEDLELSVDKKSFFIQFQKSKITLSRLDKGDKKTVKKALPHIKPPEPKLDPLEKRAEFDHSWGFSARMPMPPEAVKGKD